MKLKDILNEGKKPVNEATVKKVDGYKISTDYNAEKNSVYIKVQEPDGYPWSIERIPVSVAQEICNQLKKIK